LGVLEDSQVPFSGMSGDLTFPSKWGCDSWSPGGLPNVQRAIARVKTQWLEDFFISLESY